MLNEPGVVRIGLFEPEKTLHLLAAPKGMSNAAYKSQRGGSRSSLAFRYNFFHKAFIFVSFAVVQWWILHNLSGRKPDKSLWTQKTARKIKVNLIRQPMSKYFLQILRDIRGRRVVARMSMGGIDNSQRQWQNCTLGRENQREFYHCSCPSEMISVLNRLHRGMVGESLDSRIAWLVILDYIDSCLQGMFVYSRRERGRVIETNEDTNIEELVFCDAQLLDKSPLRRVLKRWV